MPRHRWVTATRTASRPAAAASRAGSGHACLAGPVCGPRWRSREPWGRRPAGTGRALQERGRRPQAVASAAEASLGKHFPCALGALGAWPGRVSSPQEGQRPGGGAQLAGKPRQAPPVLLRAAPVPTAPLSGLCPTSQVRVNVPPPQSPLHGALPGPHLHHCPPPRTPPVPTQPIHKRSSVEAWLEVPQIQDGGPGGQVGCGARSLEGGSSTTRSPGHWSVEKHSSRASRRRGLRGTSMNEVRTHRSPE